MADIDRSAPRLIIDDFAKEIEKAKDYSKPSKAVINFRNEQRENIERNVYRVPAELLRFRKDNGRIASDVLSYEKQYAPLIEKDEESQKMIRKFLKEKDPEKTKDLMNSIKHDGQKEPAIITSDGFLINGNRRKMALEKLYEDTGDDRFLWMRVVILPGKNDVGGPPTLKEIEKIENRYQLQTEGKAEYYNFDRAISMRQKIDRGLTLAEQLRDDPNYASLSEKDFQKALNKFNEEYLKPLECADEYLELLGRQGLYRTISTGIGDPEGRWQAFLDYYKYIEKKLRNEKDRLKLGIEENEVGKVKDVAYKLIRLGSLPGEKIHMVMRTYGRDWIANADAREELLKIKNISMVLDKEEEDSDLDEKEKDKIWAGEHKTEIMKHIQKARQICQFEDEREGPIKLLEAAQSRLNDPALELETISLDDLDTAMRLAREISERAHEIETDIYHLQKNIKNKLSGKYRIK